MADHQTFWATGFWATGFWADDFWAGGVVPPVVVVVEEPKGGRRIYDPDDKKEQKVKTRRLTLKEASDLTGLPVTRPKKTPKPKPVVVAPPPAPVQPLEFPGPVSSEQVTVEPIAPLELPGIREFTPRGRPPLDPELVAAAERFEAEQLAQQAADDDELMMTLLVVHSL